MLLLGSASFAENNAEGFESFLKEQYINQGWTAESTTQWGDAAAAVLCQGDRRMLVVRKGEQLIENTEAVPSSGYTVYMDTDTLLYLKAAHGEEATT